MSKLYTVYVSYEVRAGSADDAERVVVTTFDAEHPQIEGRKVEYIEEVE